MIKLHEHQKSVYSQFGQDGVIEQLLRYPNLVDYGSPYFVEFGSSGDDRGAGNTPYLRKRGWNGLLMDCAVSDSPHYEIHKEKITADNIEELLTKYDVPKKFGFLSIDIDGQDYWVWKSIRNWSPAIVCIESNHYLGVKDSLSVPKDNDFIMKSSYYFGASQRAILDLGNRKGYDLVSICVTDLIFLRRDSNILRDNIFGVNDLEILDVANTRSWVSETIREEVGKCEWVKV